MSKEKIKANIDVAKKTEQFCLDCITELTKTYLAMTEEICKIEGDIMNEYSRDYYSSCCSRLFGIKKMIGSLGELYQTSILHAKELETVLRQYNLGKEEIKKIKEKGKKEKNEETYSAEPPF